MLREKGTISVWFTKQLKDDEISYCRSRGVEPIVHPLIEVTIRLAGDLLQELSKAEAPQALLFTSKNAVDAYLACKVKQPNLFENIPVFSVGHQTALRLEENKIMSEWPGKAENGASVAELIAEKLKTPARILHLCSSIKRNETGEILRSYGHIYVPVTAYETIINKKATIPREQFAAAVFFSPSAVSALNYSGMKIPESAKICAIGETTASALRDAGYENPLICEQASLEGVIELLESIAGYH
ncbi:MAG: uroporphyrinogen-III synthase [Balneolales bacterium]|nr:uroporphyrinogen-III synthase [Balneolales bacterium]